MVALGRVRPGTRAEDDAGAGTLSELHEEHWALPGGVPRTAVGVAGIRAAESRRPDRLFEDPYASAFVTAARPPQPTGGGPRRREPSAAGLAMSRRIVLRTRFFDDYLTGATAGGVRQVVLLAAGLDTRAFRLAWPDGTRLFELDLPEMTAFKERVLTEQGARPACERTVVPGDLLGPWSEQLAAAGFDAGLPTAWLLEGLLIYLDQQDAVALLTEVGRVSAPGSKLSLSEARGRWRETGAVYADLFTLWKGGLGEPAGDWLERAGWTITRHARTDLETEYGRPTPAAPADPNAPAPGPDDATAAPGFDGFLIAERAG